MTSPRTETTFQVGDLLNNTFRIEAVLGSGGTSEVYRARNEISGRLVALKVLKAEFAGNESFLLLMKREEEMRDIRHDAVVGYSENHRTADGDIYLVMDFVDGPSLEARMKAGGMSAEELMVVCRRVTQGLLAAHERRIVHRDLSPDNIILKDGEPSRAVIIDFGIAKDANPGAKTVVGSDFAGKFAYAAPEQLGGETDARSDIYALGITLLATFRGAPPDMGNNLLQVLDRKKEPVDVSDVPEPLQGLLARMVAPAPLERFQSCREILSEINRLGNGGTGTEDYHDILRVAPLATDHPETVMVPHSAKPKPEPANKPKKKRGAPVLPLLLVLLLAAGGAGAWFMGLFDRFMGDSLPLAEPFVLTAEQGELGGPVVAGNVPSQEMLDRLVAEVAAADGNQSLELARGALAEGWEDTVTVTFNEALALESFTLRVEDNRIALAGQTSDPEVRDRLDSFIAAALPEGMSLDGTIDYTPPLLSPAALAPIMAEFGNCGPLSLAAPPRGGYAADDTISVTGTLSTNEARLGLYDALVAAGEGREVNIETEILNPALCEVEKNLPLVPAGGFEVEFLFGATGKPNPAGRYFVGENPVIDVIIPADVATGYLYVSIIDVTGSVFHLLPNLNRSDNAIAALRGVQEGPVSVRVAYPASEAAPSRIAFLVDDSLLGKSKVLVLHSEAPLFDTLRPTAESVGGYAQALEDEQAAGYGSLKSLDRRVLTMAEP